MATHEPGAHPVGRLLALLVDADLSPEEIEERIEGFDDPDYRVVRFTLAGILARAVLQSNVYEPVLIDLTGDRTIRGSIEIQKLATIMSLMTTPRTEER